MRIEQLQLFLQVLESGSIAAAARIQHMSQPAVSMAISSLEEEFQAKLLVRSPGQRRQIEPTEAGVLLADYSRKAIADYRNVYSTILHVNKNPKPFNVMTSYGPGACVTPQLVKHFKENYSNIPLQISPMNGNAIYQSLRNEDCTIAISATPPPEGIFSERFFSDPLVLICPRDYRIKTAISLNELQKLPLVIRNKRSGAYKMFLDALSEHDLGLSDFSVSMEVFGNSDILQAVSMGMGVGFVTRSSLTTDHNNGKYMMVPIKRFRIERYIHISRLNEHPLTDGERLFWQYALGSEWRSSFLGFNTIPGPNRIPAENT